MKIDLGTLRLAGVLRGPGVPSGAGFNIVLSLEAGEFLRVEGGEPVTIRCRSGRLWITGERSPKDLWLRSGDSATLDPEGLTLVEAVDLTHLSIARAGAA